MNSLHWMPEEDKQALASIRRERRYIDELKTDLADFREIFWAPIDGGQRSWADQMIKSIEHELNEIEAGRLGVPEFWVG